MIHIVDDTCAASAGGNHKLTEETRGLDGKHDAGNAPKDIHYAYIHHHADTQLAKAYLHHHRKGGLKEFIDIGLENALVAVQ